MRPSHRACARILLLLTLAAPGALLAGTVERDSYYQYDPVLETQRGEREPFSSLKGRPALISMFYGSCPHVCPMLISTIQQLEKQLTETQREQLQVTMISVDPEHDTPTALAELAQSRKISADRWRLARTANPADTRALAAVLGIKYKALPDGQYNHTSVIILVDAEGREIARSNRLGVPDEAFIAKLRETIR